LNYLHKAFTGKRGDIVVVKLEKQANVKLMDGFNYQLYRNGLNYKYYGGLAKVSPAKVIVPSRGRWHAVIDSDTSEETVEASIKVIKHE